MTDGQIVITIVLFILIALTALVARKLPDRLYRAIMASLMSIYSASLLVRIVMGGIDKSYDYDSYFLENTPFYFYLFGGLCAVAIIFSFIVVYTAKNKKTADKIFFCVAFAVFCTLQIELLAETIMDWGTRPTYFPGHICRQTEMVFPVIYYSWGRVRKYALPFVVFAAFAGGLSTIATGGVGEPIEWYIEFNSVIVHTIHCVAATAIYMRREYELDYKHAIWGAIGLGIGIVYGFIANVINWAQDPTLGAFGTHQGHPWNYMYLYSPPSAAMDTVTFLFLCYIVSFAFIALHIWMGKFYDGKADLVESDIKITPTDEENKQSNAESIAVKEPDMPEIG